MNSIKVDGKCVTPSKVICVGRNYVEHIKELNNEIPSSMVLFMKPNSAITDSLRAFKQSPLHYEGEISFLIRSGKIYAVGFGLDLTDRALQTELKTKGLPWERAKAFDGAAVMSEFVTIRESEIENLSMQLWINDTLVQEGGVDLMIYKPQNILEEINTFMTLEENDIVMTGTPKGVGSFIKDDIFVGKIFSSGKELISRTWVVQ